MRISLCYIGFLIFIYSISACSSSYEGEENFEKALPNQVDYNFHVKPILSDRCYACHGPDEKTREADLRLDLEEEAFAELSESEGKFAIKSGNPEKSEIYHRIYSEDEDLQMPPPSSNLSLTDYEKAILTKWIDQGADWKPHWAFIPPEKPSKPRIKEKKWVRNEIDQFILAKLEENKIKPSPEADKIKLLRRVYVDLTGLYPTPQEIEVFLADQSPNAYEQAVDRLLASNAYGERMALEWMDVARYADSHGLHADGWRLMWPWRDWVIKAFNENMPYDQFITKQLAGDLLENPSRDDILATAFQRNHPMTGEGGVVDEEFRLGYVMDRTNTTATAFMGLTMECAQCHDHKFDPISQKEYFQMTAFFNNVKELGMTGDDGNYGPMLMLPSAKKEQQLEEIHQAIEGEVGQLTAQKKYISETQDFINKLSKVGPPKAKFRYPLDRFNNKLIDGNKKARFAGNPELVPGRHGKAIRLEGNFEYMDLDDAGQFESYDHFSISMWVKPDSAGKVQTLAANSGDKNNFWRGWILEMDSSNNPYLQLIHSYPHNYIDQQSMHRLEAGKWNHLVATYDGSGKAAGIHFYINGKKAPGKTRYDHLYKSTLTIRSGDHALSKRPIRIGRSYRGFTGEYGIFTGAFDEIQFFDETLSELEARQLFDPTTIESILKSPEEHQQLLAEYYFLRRDDKSNSLRSNLKDLRKNLLQAREDIPEVMVMEEMPAPRQAFVLARGQYDAPEEKVFPNTPKAVLDFPQDLPKNRLGLAQWLTAPGHPLTARVTVNRYWQMIFGKGIVQSPQDFGNQGNLPTHPELLDWLSMDFVEHGWNVKHLLKTMVMSATYRQTSKARNDLLEIDPQNNLYARGASFRLQAEFIRDHALAASGLLSDSVGGPSAKPYQPEGLWIELGNFSAKLLHYKPDSGNALYRKSMYTFIRRTSPPPAMRTFDVPNRNICVVKRENTNTPLQALVLMNDPQFVEAARVLAERIQSSDNTDISSQINQGFQLVCGREGNPEELKVLMELFQSEKERFKADQEQANSLLAIGESVTNTNLDPAHTAALTMVCNTLFNYDEAYMKR